MDGFSYNVSYTDVIPQQLIGPMYVISFIMCVLALIAAWKVFEKAGLEGWKALIPIYNTYKEFEFATGDGWMFLLILIPIINIIALIWFFIQLAKSFGKPKLFAVGLIFLSTIFYLILAFDDSEYIGPKGIPSDSVQ